MSSTRKKKAISTPSNESKNITKEQVDVDLQCAKIIETETAVEEVKPDASELNSQDLSVAEQEADINQNSGGAETAEENSQVLSAQADAGKRERNDEPIVSVEVVRPLSDNGSALTATKTKRKFKYTWQLIVASIIFIPILTLAMIGLFTDLFGRENGSSKVSYNDDGSFLLLIDYNLPDPLREFSREILELTNIPSNGIMSTIVSVNSGYVTPNFQGSKFEKYFLGWVVEDEVVQGKITGEKDTSVVVRGSWNEDALLAEYYTPGLQFDCAKEECRITGVADDFSATRVFIPKVYDGKPVTEISAGAFKGTGVQEVYLLSEYCGVVKSSTCGVKICDSAFEGSELTEISFKIVNKIGSYAFKNCKNLKVDLKGSMVKSIGDFAFDGTQNLESFVLPACVENLGRDIFGSTTVKEFNLKLNNNFEYVDNILYKVENDKRVLTRCAPNREGIIFMADNVKEIAPYAFDGTTANLIVCIKGEVLICGGAFSNSKAVVAIGGSGVNNQDNISNLCVLVGDDSFGFDTFDAFELTKDHLVIVNSEGLTESFYLYITEGAFDNKAFIIKVKLNEGVACIDENFEIQDVSDYFVS